MNISTTYPFNGKHLSGKIYDKWIQKTYPGLAFSDVNTNGFDTTSLEKLAVVNVSTLTEIRDEINELITFMVSLEADKEKASDEDKQEEPRGLIVSVVKCQRCGKDHKIKFMNLINPADKYTMWGMCENTHQPVLMGMKDVDEQNKIAIDEIVAKSKKHPTCELCHKCSADGTLVYMGAKSTVNVCLHCGTQQELISSAYKFVPFDKQDEEKPNSSKHPICEICKNNVSEGILYCRFNTVPTETHTCIPCGSSRSGNLPFYTFIPYEGIKHE